MKKLKYFILLFITILISFVSCEKVLEEEIVSDITSEYLSTPDGFEAGINACYQRLNEFYAQEHGGNLTVFGTDEYTNGAHGRYKPINQYEAGLNSEAANFWIVWSRFYPGINTCNAVIGRSEELDMSANKKNAKVAEAHFLRAHYYFILVELFGPIHLTLEETVGVETEADRKPEEDVYGAIIKDLEFAVEYLPVTQKDFGRATEPAAKHMLALVHLTRSYKSFGSADDYTTAASLANSVINDYGLELDADPVARYDHDNEQHPEILWSIQFTEDPILTPRGNEYHLFFTPNYHSFYEAGGLKRALGKGYGRPFQRYRPTGWFLNNFRINGGYDVDSRFNKSFQLHWIFNDENSLPEGASVGDTAIYLTGEDLTLAMVDSIEARHPAVIVLSWHENAKGKTWSWYTDDGSENGSLQIFPKPWKYEDNKRPSVNYKEGSRDFIVYSLPETYLIAAEALLQSGNTSDAVDLINDIRTRAANPGKKAEMEISASDLDIDFILDERSRELFGEMKRWFDLKRTGKLLERVKAYNPDAAPNIQDYHVLRPIPANQRTRTTNEYPQNDGY